MKKANNINNLKPFKKGESGNPAGRPPKLPALDEILAEVLSKPTSVGVPMAKKILLMLANKASRGDIRAAELLLDRAYGKAKQVILNHEEEDERLVFKIGYGNTPEIQANNDAVTKKIREKYGKFKFRKHR